MKKLIYLIIAILVVTACSNEEELIGKIDLGNEFVIEDDPNDPVQHERYSIYQDYNTPVYFNDTIAKKQVDTDWYGNSIIRYETVDLNWTFDSYAQGIKYQYEYIETTEEQMTALSVARRYLELCSKRMRPYSILLVDTLRIKSGGKLEKPQYHAGFRTLVLAQVKDLEGEEAVEKISREVIKKMVADRVKVNLDLCGRFKAISSDHGWYGKLWKDLGGCESAIQWLPKSWKLNVNSLFNGDPYDIAEDDPEFAEKLLQLGLVQTLQEGEAEVAKILLEIGNYGFIRGDDSAGTGSPASADNDRNAFIGAILYLGADGFTERYGASPLVMKKYELLYDYITTELGVKL